MPKQTKTRYLEFGSPVVKRRPKGATPADLVKVLADAALGKPLPSGWAVDQRWRNRPSEDAWKQKPVMAMLRESAGRGGDFNGIYLERFLAKQARRYGVTLDQPREATAAEIAADERGVDRRGEFEAGSFEVLRQKQLRTAAKAKRKAAAARNFARVQRAAAAKYEKRRAAALKGLETRKRNAAAAARTAKAKARTAAAKAKTKGKR